MKLFESKLSTKSRNALSDSEFGLPNERKYPLNDESHIRKAIQFFKFCPEKDRATLAANINKAVNKAELEITVSKENPFSKYAGKSKYITVTEKSYLFESESEMDFINFKDYESDDRDVAISYAVMEDILNEISIDPDNGLDVLIAFVSSSDVIDDRQVDYIMTRIIQSGTGLKHPEKMCALELAINSKPRMSTWINRNAIAYTKTLKNMMFTLRYMEQRKNETKNELYIIDEYIENDSLTESAIEIENLLNYNIDPWFIRKLTLHENYSLGLNPLDVVKLSDKFDKVFESRDILGNKVWYGVDNSEEGLYVFLKENNDDNVIYGVKLSNPKQARVLTEKFTPSETFSVRTMDWSKCNPMTSKMMTAPVVLDEGLSIDKDGNIKVSIMKKKSYMDLYSENHKILMQNVENQNNEGIKTNLATAFALISMIERDKKYQQRDSELVKARAFLINDFKTYLKALQKEEPDFNFAEYYASKDYDKIVVDVPAESISGIAAIVKRLLTI